MMAKTKKIVIIGGGISGLACAYKLKELIQQHHVPLEVTLIESQKRFGGIIETCQEEGVLFESGPDIFLSEKTEIVNLCKKLGLREELISVRSKHRRSYVLYKKKLHKIPKGFYMISSADPFSFFSMTFISLRAKFRLLFEYFAKPKRDDKDESVASFVRRRFGREILDKIGQPMIGGIYSADPEKLSLKATFSKFLNMEQKYGSVMKGLIALKAKQETGEAAGPRYHLFLSFRCGMETLTKALVRNLEGMKLMSETRAEKVSRAAEGWTVELADSSKLQADAVCLTVPAYTAASLLQETDGELSAKLHEIEYESAATVNMVFEEEALTKRFGGVGFVVPKTEKRSIIGCTMSSNKFPYRTPFNTVLIRAFVGGAFGRETFQLTDQELIEKVIEDVMDILKIEKRPTATKLKRYERAMPQYEVGHLEKVSAIESATGRHPGLFMAGNYLRGVGIPDCALGGEYNARKMFDFLYNNISGNAGNETASTTA